MSSGHSIAVCCTSSTQVNRYNPWADRGFHQFSSRSTLGLPFWPSQHALSTEDIMYASMADVRTAVLLSRQSGRAQYFSDCLSELQRRGCRRAAFESCMQDISKAVIAICSNDRPCTNVSAEIGVALDDVDDVWYKTLYFDRATLAEAEFYAPCGVMNTSTLHFQPRGCRLARSNGLTKSPTVPLVGPTTREVTVIFTSLYVFSD
jgi:hypothetical protein